MMMIIIYIYISDLSRHTKNLIDTCKVSIMFIEDESMADNIFARKRLTINVDAELIERKTEKWYEKINFLEDNFGETIKYLKEMNDFHLFRLIPKDALLVYGFGKAFRFTGKKLNQLKHLNDEGHKREKTT